MTMHIYSIDYKIALDLFIYQPSLFWCRRTSINIQKENIIYIEKESVVVFYEGQNSNYILSTHLCIVLRFYWIVSSGNHSPTIACHVATNSRWSHSLSTRWPPYRRKYFAYFLLYEWKRIFELDMISLLKCKHCILFIVQIW